jgi:hypothetical protein
MNEDQDWNQIENAWKASSPIASDIAQAVKQVQSDDRAAACRLWISISAACVAIVVITSWCAFYRSVETYTFTVIAWSAVFSLGSYLLSSRESASDLMAETSTALERRARSLSRAAKLLEFGRTLIGVEILICAGFWIALHHRDLASVLRMTGGILFAGISLYLVFTRILARTRGELRGLESIATDLRKASD